MFASCSDSCKSIVCREGSGALEQIRYGARKGLVFVRTILIFLYRYLSRFSNSSDKSSLDRLYLIHWQEFAHSF